MPRRKAEAGLEPNRRAELLRAAARLFQRCHTGLLSLAQQLRLQFLA